MAEDAAWVLSVLYGKVIEIVGTKGSVNQRSKLSSIRTSTHERKIAFRLSRLSLDSFTVSIEIFLASLTAIIVRVPLTAIVNCIEMALDNKIDEKTRQVLGRAQQASVSSMQVMEELLRLTKVEDPNPKSVEKSFNLNQTGK